VALASIVRVPLLDSVEELTATAYARLPGPLPLLPVVIVIHDALAAALHAQAAGAVTVTLPVPASGPNVRVAGAIAIDRRVPARSVTAFHRSSRSRRTPR
jgi:hypothetical protein